MTHLSRNKFNALIGRIILLIFLIILIKATADFATTAIPDIQSFVRLRGNYQELKNQQGIFKIASQLREIIPPGSSVYMSDKYSGSIEWIAVRYTLYPSVLKTSGDYFLDIDHSQQALFRDHERRKLAFDVYAYAMPGHSFRPPQPPQPRGSPFLVWTGFILLQLFLGFSLSRCFRLHWDRMGRGWCLLTYYLIGFSVLTALVWLWLVFGGAFHPGLFWSLFFIILILTLGAYAQKTAFGATQKYDLGKQKSSILVQSAGCLILGFIALWIISRPAIDWDTMTNWLIKSKVLAHEPVMNLDFTKINHNYYPILWPLNIAIPFFINGGQIDFMAKFTAAFFYLTFMAQLYFALKLFAIKNNLIWIILSSFSILLVRENPFNSAMPESAFLTFFAGLMISIILWSRYPKEKQYLMLAFIFSLTLNLLKIEGVFVSFFIVLSLYGAYYSKFSRQDLIRFGALMLLAALMPFLWLVWSKQQGFWGQILHYQEPLSATKFILIIRLHLHYFLQKGEGLIFTLIFAHLCIQRNPRTWSPTEKFLLYNILLLMLFKWIAVIGWTEQMLTAKTVFPDGQWRLFLHVCPALVLLWASRAFTRNESAPDEAPQR